MKKLVPAILALAFLLPALAGCTPDFDSGTAPGKKPDKENKTESPLPAIELRTLETVTLNHNYQGKFETFPEDFLGFVQGGVYANGMFYLAGSRENGEASHTYYTVSAEDGSTGYREIPRMAQITKNNERHAAAICTVGEKGTAIIDRTVNYDPETDQAISYNRAWLTVYDSEGSIRCSIDPEPLVQVRENPLTGSESDYEFAPELRYAANGTLYLVQEYSIVAIGEAGEKLYETEPGAYIYDSMMTADGRLLVQYSVPQKDSAKYWAYMDDEQKGFSRPIVIPDPDLKSHSLVMGAGHDFYFNARDGLYYMDAGETTPILLCDWAESGIKQETIDYLLIADEETVCVVITENPGNIRKYAILKRPPVDASSTRQVITLGEYSRHIDFEEYVAAFNRQNDTYYIVIRDYDKRAKDGGNTLTEDILAENAPDIVFYAFNVLENLAQKGAFTDLMPYLEADTAFREDLLSCVTESYETDGKLYWLISGIRITGLSGKAKNLPTVEEWTPDAFVDFVSTAEKNGKTAVSYPYRAQMQRTLIEQNLSAYVDFDNAVCSFESELFTDVLKYLKALPENGSAAIYSADARKAYREDNALLDPMSTLSSFQDMMVQHMQFAGEQVTYLGNPTPDGGVPALNAGEAFAVSAASPVKEGAWEFIRMILSEELLHYGKPSAYLPVTRTNLLRQAELEGASWYVFPLDSGGVSGLRLDNSPTPEYDPQKQEALRITEEVVQFVLDLLDTRTFYPVKSAAHEVILTLINEELSAYYAGNVSAEETAHRIQSRVSIYLAEQS